MQPAERLSGTPQFFDLVENQCNRFLHAPVGILFVAVSGLNEANGRCHDQLAPARLLVTGRERALAQQIEFVLVEPHKRAWEKAGNRTHADNSTISGATHWPEH